ncbi:MAG: glycosyltransferase family 1 protein [Prevotella sp.]|nr:glycosyltransferase family 1 protein [Prevotella sp.]
MKILLLGEYSNVHWTLAQGLRALGHQVTVLSNGDFWKDYPRDIDLVRVPTKWGGIKYMARLLKVLLRLRGYDVVQLINPMFLELKANRIFPVYRYLRLFNRKVFLAAYGMDFYWVHECITRIPLRYSDFNIGQRIRTGPEAQKEYNDWLGTDKGRLNRYMAKDCDGIIAGLYEYWTCYHPNFPEKTAFIPFPIRPAEGAVKSFAQQDRVKIFIGLSKGRSVYKGTDIMLAAAKDLAAEYPKLVELKIAEGLPFAEYIRQMEGCDMILDQLYSYTPAMNALAAMDRGIVCVGGGEPENYEIIHEDTLRPIINVLPDYDSVYQALKAIITHPEQLPELKAQSVAYVRKHHHYVKVAQEYVKVWLGE